MLKKAIPLISSHPVTFGGATMDERLRIAKSEYVKLRKPIGWDKAFPAERLMHYFS